MEKTEKQKQASRENGKAGGVKTTDGKAISKMNALKHGILAYTATDYDPVSGVEIFEQLSEEFGTGTPSRHLLVEQLALTVLRLARCVRAETEILREGLNPRIVETKSFDWPMSEEIVHSEGELATLSTEFLERLALLYERYEPRLVSRMLRLLDALKAG